MNDLKPYLSFWNYAFALNQDIQNLQGLHFVSEGPYLQRDLSRIYIFKTGDCTIVAAAPEIMQKLSKPSFGKNDFDQKTLEENIGPVEKIFDDIDHHLSSWSAHLPIEMHVRRLGIHDKDLVEKMYEDCSEDDKDTTEPNLESDVVWGSFDGEKLVALACYYVIPNSSIADLAVATANTYRGRGHAVKALRAVVQEAVTSGLSPRYRARRSNLATLKTAARLGFIPHATIQVFEPKD